MSTASLLWHIPQTLGPWAVIALGIGAAAILTGFALLDTCLRYGEWDC